MIVIEDTRNQIGKHKAENAYFEAQGIKVIRSKMLVGDYMIADKGNIAVDTKKDVLELFMDLTRDHKRFRNECILAQEAGIQLVVLIEEELPAGGLARWQPPLYRYSNKHHKRGDPYTLANPATMRKVMITMCEKYGVKFEFCPKEQAGVRILQILKR